MKNIKHDSDLYNLINSSIINVSPIRDDTDPTISINNGTYNINGYLANKMLTHIIKLYYIENFKYTLDVSQYTIENGENIDTSKRGNTYMFTNCSNIAFNILIRLLWIFLFSSACITSTGTGSSTRLCRYLRRVNSNIFNIIIF